MKTYIKKGNKNYKERKMLDELEPILAAKKEKDENFTFTQARNFEDLKTLYSNHVVEDVSSEDISTEIESENIEKDNNMAKTVIEKDNSETSTNSQFIDPFNQKEPIVRDYVFGDQSLEKNPGEKNNDKFSKMSFDEPQSFQEAFIIPDDEESEPDGKTEAKSEGDKKSKETSEPINPKWDEMKGSVQKKKTKKFAKYIVEAVSVLQQKGFVWFANKDINDAKLNEYELNGEMDLSLLVTLGDGQEVTVKEFFQAQCIKAEQLSHITPEQKEDLTDSLTEVLMEQGAGPTPTQELMLVALTIIGGQALTLMTLKSETNSLLSQLRSMEGESGGKEYQEPWHQQEEVKQPEQPEQPGPTEQLKEEVKPEPEEKEQIVETNKPFEIGETIETKE
tara:strand:- start:2217 stop:3392 length:1176 start_codon:yes stop_codon:yes gene_type:complete